MRRWGCYSDDMILSSGDPFSRPAAVAALRELTHAVQGYGFEPHAHPVDGLVAYALGAETQWARPVQERWRGMLRTQGWSLG